MSYQKYLSTINNENNLDAVRYFLSISVFIKHFNEIINCHLPWPMMHSYPKIGGFFALSGFLMIGSFFRRQGNAKEYIINRTVRLMPPYIFIVVLCAVLFCTISTLPIAQYFTSPKWWKYVVSNVFMLNFIEPSLPGVFADHADTAVNGSLWTLKVNWMLYLTVPVVFYFIVKKKFNIVLVITTLFIISAAYRIYFYDLYLSTGKGTYEMLSRQFVGQLIYFYMGAMIYIYFDKFMAYKWLLFALAIALIAVRNYTPYYPCTTEPIATTIILMVVAFTGRWASWLRKYYNISFEIFLFHFPVFQLLVHFKINQHCNPWVTFAISLIIVVILSNISHRTIGKLFKPKPPKTQISK